MHADACWRWQWKATKKKKILDEKVVTNFTKWANLKYSEINKNQLVKQYFLLPERNPGAIDIHTAGILETNPAIT